MDKTQMMELASLREARTHVMEAHVAPAPPTLADLLDTLRRRKAIALQTFILVVALGIVATLMTKPQYRSTSRVLVEGKAQTLSINSTDDPLSSLFLPAAGHEVQTQVEIFRSPVILDKVYKSLKLPPKSVRVDVKQVPTTDVIELSVVSTNRETAEKFATALPEVYLQDKRGSRLKDVTTALAFARRRLKEENTALRETEGALERFKRQSGVVDPQGERTQAISAVGQAESNVTAAAAQVASIQAQLTALLSTRRQLSPFVTSPVTTTNDDQIRELTGKISDLQSERARLLFLYKPDNDEVRKVDLQIKDLQRRLANTPRTITKTSRSLNPEVTASESKIAEVRAALGAAQANLRTLQAREAGLKAGLNKFNPIERQQAQLLRNLADGGRTVEQLSKSVEELSLRQKAIEAASDPVTVIQTASAAEQVAPRVSRNFILAIMLGLMLACGAALLQESMDDRIRDEGEARRLLNTPILGFFPLRQAEEGLGLLSLASPDRQLLENYRMLRTNVQFTLMNGVCNSLMVTSSVPQEGKSSTASNLAVAMALDGRRVVLIDCDMHRPRQHSIFSVPRHPGLSNVLAGQANVEEAIYETNVAGLRVIPAGVVPPNPAELLNSIAMTTVLDALKKDADMIICDCPPLLATADAQVLGAKVDGVLYVMHMGAVPKKAIQRSFELLRQANAHIIGMVMNKVDDHSSRAGYYSYGYDYHSTSEDGDDAIKDDITPAVSANGHGHVSNGQANKMLFGGSKKVEKDSVTAHSDEAHRDA